MRAGHTLVLPALGAVLFVGLLLLVPWALESLKDVQSPVPEPQKKVFKRILGEDVHVTRHGFYGIDFVRCGACRLEKKRQGPLTFGGLNVLVLEDLWVVLPEIDDGKATRTNEADRVEAREILGGMGMGESFLRAQGISRKFSGLRIERLEVARLEGTNVVSVFTAMRGEAKRDGLHLRNCSTIMGNMTNLIGNAVLKLKPVPRLCWSDGELVLNRPAGF